MAGDSWLELAERAEKASSPDRRIDYEVFMANAKPEAFNHWDPDDDRHRYTTSVDATLSLIEETLPAIDAFPAGSPSSSGWKIGLYRGMTPTGQKYASWEAVVRPHAGENEAWGSTPALALLAAYCRARSALARSEGGQDA